MSAPDGIYMVTLAGIPTVLVNECDSGLHGRLIQALQCQGYFVLEAHNASQALEFVKIHSRPIHLMVTNDGPGGRNLASIVKMYRRAISVLFVAGSGEDSPDRILSKIQELVTLPGNPSDLRRVAPARALGTYG
jgi:hypothetical protein